MTAPRSGRARDSCDVAATTAPSVRPTIRPAVRPPTLGDYLRAARRERRLSRDQLALAAAVSSSYVAQLETGEKAHPTVAALRALAAVLDLGPTELRHLYDLARISPGDRDELRDTEQLADAITPEMQLLIDSLDPTLATYLDNHWNIISANAAHARAFPGLIECGNVLRWLFTTPQARCVMVEWDKEASLSVHWFRGMMGQHDGDAAGARLLDELSESPEFARLWLDERIDFGRSNPYMHLREPDTGELYTLNVQLHSVQTPARTPLLIFIGSRIPYAGPMPEEGNST